MFIAFVTIFFAFVSSPFCFFKTFNEDMKGYVIKCEVPLTTTATSKTAREVALQVGVAAFDIWCP